MVSICIFGDSIGEGYYDSEKGGWVSQLKRYLKTPNKNLNIYNCSISGDSTREVLRRFAVEIKAKKPQYIFFALGTNDSWYFDNNKNKPNVSLSDFKNNIKTLILKSQEKDFEIIFIGLPKVDETKVMPVPWQTDIFYDNENIILYNNIIKKVCLEFNLRFIDINSLLDNDDLLDGLHPNTKGHIKLFERIKKGLPNF